MSSFSKSTKSFHVAVYVQARIRSCGSCVRLFLLSIMPVKSSAAKAPMKVMKVMKAPMKASRAMKPMKGATSSMKSMKAVKAMKANENTKGFPKRMYYKGGDELLTKPSKRNDRDQSFEEIEERLHEEWIDLRDNTSSYKVKNKSGRHFVSSLHKIRSSYIRLD